MAIPIVVAEGLYFGEGPRWHNGRLWFSDFYDHAIKSLGSDGELRVEFEIDDQPSGLGWLPDGRLLVVSMKAMKLLCLDGNSFKDYADLSAYSAHLCNDMVVDGQGRAWVGNFGFDLDAARESSDVATILADPPTTNLVRVDPDGSVHCAAPGMRFPNGSVVTPDGSQLIVAETLGTCLTAFDIEADGSLSNRRVWAPTPDCAPDGICLDASGSVWVANPLSNQCLRYAPGGDVLDVVEASQNCYACMLGGDDGTDLYIMTAQDSDHKAASGNRTGRVEVARVSVAGAGYP